jgi:hypothetical protein
MGSLLFTFSVEADDSSQPYIDHLKKEQGIPDAPADGGSSSPYIDSLKSKPGAPVPGSPDSSDGYSEKIKAFLDKKGPNPEASASPSYTDEEKSRLGPPTDSGAIQAYKEGHSDLKYEKKGEIKYSFGLRYGVGLTRNILADSTVGTGTPFQNIYGGNYAPDFALYAEYYLFRGDVGKLSIFGMAGAGIFQGYGNFAVPPTDASSTTGATLSQNSSVLFHFIEVPGIIGFDYRFALSKYVQPFVMLGPSLIVGFESRNDGGNTLHVLSKAGYGAAGFSILMDWVSRKDDWARYQEEGFIHAYLDIQYSQLKSFSGDVNYSVGGPSIGVSFEY